VRAVIGTRWEGALVEAAFAGEAILSTLRAGDRLVAAELGMASGAVYQAYLGAFDPQLARYSLGQEQMLRTIAWCFEAGVSAYDLLAPPDPYKSHWARAETATAIVDALIPLSMPGRLAAFVETHGRASAKHAAERLPETARAMLARLS
jgi:CelD/BcsL family acetyltransferase involved in cellulose biosynthesis